MISCADDVSLRPLQEATEKQPLNAKFEKVIQQAVNARAEYYPESESRASSTKPTIDFIVDAQSRAENPDTLIYVVNFPNNEGYALIGNDNVDNRLLGIVPRGSYNVEDGSDNPGLNFFLDAAKNYVTTTYSDHDFIIDTTFVKVPEYKLVYDTIYNYNVNPLLGACEWGQDKFYGKYCPNGLCGCVPLAMGTVISCYNFQNNIDMNAEYDFPEKVLDSQTISWKRIYQHKREEHERLEKVNGQYKYITYPEICYAGVDKEGSHENIAHLLRQLGKEVMADYRTNPFVETVVWEYDIPMVLPTLRKYLPYRVITEYADYKNINMSSQIDKGLVIVFGVNTEIGYGHCWIADGYHKCKYTKTLWKTSDQVVTLPGERGWEIVSSETVLDSTIHMNWGWHGADNGYFAGDVIEVKNLYFDKVFFTNIRK